MKGIEHLAYCIVVCQPGRPIIQPNQPLENLLLKLSAQQVSEGRRASVMREISIPRRDGTGIDLVPHTQLLKQQEILDWSNVGRVKRGALRGERRTPQLILDIRVDVPQPAITRE